MGIILGALAGAGKAAGEIADSNIKLWGEQDLIKLRGDIEQQKVMALENFKAQRADQTRQTMVGAIDKGAKGIVAGRMAGNQVADTSTWTPEQEAARNAGMNEMAQDPSVRARAAADAGYFSEASALDKMGESGASNVPWGATRVDANGKVIYDNASDVRSDLARTRAEGNGRGKGNGLDQKDVDDITSRATKMADERTKDKQNPYSTDPDEKGDPAYSSVLKAALSLGISRAAMGGRLVVPAEAMDQIIPILNRADTAVRKQAEIEANALFEGKSSWGSSGPDNKKMAAMQAQGVPTWALADSTSFKRYYREQMLEKTFLSMVRGGPKAAPASEPAVKEKTDSAKSEPKVVEKVAPAAAPKQKETPQAQALDEARKVATAALKKLRSFGLNQRRSDPQGFKQAEVDYQAAVAAEKQALKEYQATVDTGGPSVQYKYF